MMNNTTTSFDLLANLMAEEDIQVVHGNYPTAMFNIEQRVMYLPMWKDISNNLEILLRAHECGHALYTPISDIHNCEDFAKIRAAVNIVEDARIERLLKQKFPGLRNVFRAAYKEIWERGFFGTSNIDDVNQYNLLDRLNIATKMGVETGVEFYNDIEHDFLVKVMSTQSFDQVVKLARDIVDYCKSTKSETYDSSTSIDQQQQGSGGGDGDDQQQQQQPDDSSGESIENEIFEQQNDSDSADDDNTSTSGDIESEDAENGGTESENLDDSEEQTGEQSDDNDSTDSGAGSADPIDEEVRSKTDSSFHDNEKGLIDYDENVDGYNKNATYVINEQSNPNQVIFGYSDFIKQSNDEMKGNVFTSKEMESLIDKMV